MYFSYSPQRSNDARIDYRFELSRKRIIVIYRTGSEVTKKVGGTYETRFNENGRAEYVLNLDSKPYDFSEWPFNPLIELNIVEGFPYLKLLKPYGPEENELSIRFPGWNKVDGDISEKDIVLKTALNSFSQFSILWMDQLSEIKCQIYNLLNYLFEEYGKINSGGHPLPSPISIRTLKASIFQNTILYIEAAANFLSTTVIRINDQIDGSPNKIASLEQGDIDKLKEANGKYIRLEDKLIFSIGQLNKLLSGNIKIDKGNCNWGKFKDFKKRRDSITHLKIHDHVSRGALTLDHVAPSLRITDDDISCCMELLCWFNALLNDAAELIGNERFPNHHSFNDYICGISVKLSCSIADIPSKPTLQKYNIAIYE